MTGQLLSATVVDDLGCGEGAAMLIGGGGSLCELPLPAFSSFPDISGMGAGPSLVSQLCSCSFISRIFGVFVQ